LGKGRERGKLFGILGKFVNLGMWRQWWRKYKEKKALKKKLEEGPDFYWVPRRFGDKIIMCRRANTSKHARRWI
jgi:hypothetical protein